MDKRLTQLSEDLKSLASQRLGKEILQSGREVREVFLDMGYAVRSSVILYTEFRRVYPHCPPIFRSTVVEWIKRTKKKGRRKLTHRMLHALKLRKEGLTYEEIGRKMGIQKPAAFKLVQRAVRVLGKESIEPSVVAQGRDYQNGNPKVQT